MKLTRAVAFSLLTVLLAVPAEAQVSLKLPWHNGESWVLTCGYGCGFHTDVLNSYYALDFDKPGLSEDGPPQAVLAPVSGTVIFAGLNRGFGYSVKIDAGNGFVVMVSHLRFESTVSGFVTQGQPIGIMGGTGSGGAKVYNDHIHLQLYFSGRSRSFISQSKPEPMSGYTDFRAGQSYISDNVPIASSLRISTASCPTGITCTGPQGTTFNFGANGLTPGGAVRRFIEDSTGVRTQLIPVLTADPDGRIAWTFTSSCTTSPGMFRILAADVTVEKESNRVTETITPGDCAPPPTGGSLDPTFGVGGRVTTDFGGIDEHALALAFQPDGKILVTGIPGFVARYNSDGTLDLGFGVAGRTVSNNLVPNNYGARGLAVQPDGKIVVGGTFACNVTDSVSACPERIFLPTFTVLRFNSDGTPDTTFGTQGRVLTAFGSGAYYDAVAEAMSLQVDGKILLAGWTGNSAFAVARYNADGSLDGTFASGGKLVTAFGCQFAEGKAVASQPDGRIVVAGFCVSGPSNSVDFLLARLNSDGTLDTGFGSGGIAVTDFQGFDDYPSDIAIQADGKIVVAGTAQPGSGLGFGFGIVRYHSNGILDSGFGNAGKVATPFGSVGIPALGIQGDGRLVCTAAVNFFGGNLFVSPDVGLVRYNVNGTLDVSFGTEGKVVTKFESPGFALARALGIQPDGKILVAGSATRGLHAVPNGIQSTYDIALARYIP